MILQDAIMPPFAAWESFYVIVGSSGAALTGLQFVVMALVADSRRATSSDTINAYGTPTIVHFCVVLFVSSVLSAPWQSLTKPAAILGLCGAAGDCRRNHHRACAPPGRLPSRPRGLDLA